MLKHIGIAAVSAEGAALCYRTICAEAAALLGPHAHPEVTMHTYPLSEYVRHMEAGRWDEVANLLFKSANILARAGADFVICPDNTAHQAFDLFMSRSPLPWLHIAGEVAEVASSRGCRRVGILGTRFLMEGPVYPQKLAALGLEFEIPAPDDRESINRIIFDELVYGRFDDKARRFLQDVIRRLKDAECDAVALACTEIPLLIGEADSALPTLDSTRILARAALREAVAHGGNCE
ncbi:MAG: amino acid racemase [Candidatus Binataceae bacterium]